MRNSKTQYVILGLLTEGPMTGYDIKKIIDIRFSFFWNESYGQLYPMLKALTDNKLITADKSSGGRAKVTYAITQAGRDALVRWLEAPVERETLRIELLLKMYFSGQTGTDVIKKHIRDYKDAQLKQLTVLNGFENELRGIANFDNHMDVLRVVAFGQKAYNAYIEWCDETLDYLEGKEK